jgi:hypothetical protein
LRARGIRGFVDKPRSARRARRLRPLPLVRRTAPE